MKRIAIIPARSGSKRIPDKNIIPLCKKPLLFWAIDLAKDSKLFDRIIVSTDSKYYSEIAIERGAECPFLRKESFDDYSPVSEATRSALIQSNKFFNEHYDTVVQLMPNCPLRKLSSLKNFIESFESCKTSSLISGFEFGWMNPNWAYEENKFGIPKALFPERINKRSQDLKTLYCPSGAIWVTSESNLLNFKTFYVPEWRFKIIPWQEAIDIDNYSDLEMAEILYLKNRKNHNL